MRDRVLILVGEQVTSASPTSSPTPSRRSTATRSATKRRVPWRADRRRCRASSASEGPAGRQLRHPAGAIFIAGSPTTSGTDGPLRLYCVEGSDHVADKYLTKYGQFLEGSPLTEPDMRTRRRSSWRTPTRPTRTPRSTSSTGATGSGHRVDGRLRPPPLRRGRLDGQPVRLQLPGLRAGTGLPNPSSAGLPGAPGQRLRRLQLRPRKLELPPAGDQGALLPLQRRLRRGDVLLRGRDRGPGGVGIRDGSVSLHPAGYTQARGVRPT